MFASVVDTDVEPELPDDPEEPDDPDEPDDPEEPEDPEDPDDPEEPEDPDEVPPDDDAPPGPSSRVVTEHAAAARATATNPITFTPTLKPVILVHPPC
jgi:hypothetical protein